MYSRISLIVHVYAYFDLCLVQVGRNKNDAIQSFQITSIVFFLTKCIKFREKTSKFSLCHNQTIFAALTVK